MSEMFEMRLTYDQVEWVLNRDKIQSAVEKEIADVQELALRLAGHIGGMRLDIVECTGLPLREFPIDQENDDRFTKRILRLMNGSEDIDCSNLNQD